MSAPQIGSTAPHPKRAYGVPPFLQSIDTIHWGRKTYEQALAFGGVDAIPTVVRLYYAIPARR